MSKANIQINTPHTAHTQLDWVSSFLSKVCGQVPALYALDTRSGPGMSGGVGRFMVVQS